MKNSVVLSIMGRRKKSAKLNEMSQAHGKAENFQPTTLDQIWGDTGLSKYGTLDENEYKTKLDDMSKSDIYAHAASLGIVPVDNRDLLVRTLMKEFLKFSSAYKRPTQDAKNSPQDIPPEVLKILSEGR